MKTTGCFTHCIATPDRRATASEVALAATHRVAAYRRRLRRLPGDIHAEIHEPVVDLRKTILDRLRLLCRDIKIDTARICSPPVCDLPHDRPGDHISGIKFHFARGVSLHKTLSIGI